MTSELSEICLGRLSGLIESRLGLHFPAERWKDLSRGVAMASRDLGFTDAQACCDWLLTSAISSAQIDVLASHLTIGETYFFRDPSCYEALKQHIVPEWLRAHPDQRQPLRIWSAGCSTGEEPYTIAMVLDALPGKGLNNHDASVLATDINPGFLKMAARGVYREWSFRNLPPAGRQRHFRKTAEGAYRVLPEVRNKVTFAYLNLVEDQYPSLLNHTNAVDIIFCRNVLMYFAETRRQQVLRRFYRCLTAGGWLVVSSIEASLVHDAMWSRVRYPDYLLFRKIPGHEFQPEVTPPAPVAPAPELPVQLPPPIAPPPAVVAPPAPARKQAAAAPGSILYEEALRLFEQERHAEVDEKLTVLLTLEKGNMPAMALMARVRANQGRLFEALEWCDKVLALNKLDPALHYLVATILIELGRQGEARTALKRVLYLDPDFALASFTLGNLAWQEGKTQEARRYFERVLALLKRYDPGAVIPASGGMTAGRLMQIAQAMAASGNGSQ